MRNYGFLIFVAAAFASLPTSANAFCMMPNSFANPPPSQEAWAIYDNCVQQQRQLELQRQQMELQRKQMLQQQLDMQRQQLEMQRQTRIQEEQLRNQKLEMQQQKRIQEEQLTIQRQQFDIQKSSPAHPQKPLIPGKSLNDHLSSLARLLNQDLPTKLDDVTTLERIEASNGSLIIIHSTNLDLRNQQQVDQIAKFIVPIVCDDPNVNYNVNVLGAKYIYRYFTTSGRYADVLLNPGSC
ncbi:hypothetical protein MCEREM21A_00949 [Sphingomonadaceae bacterium]